MMIENIIAREVYILLSYAKSGLAVLATILTALVGVQSGGIDPAEWINIGIVAATALLVFAAPNVPGARYTKSAIAVVLALLSFLTSAITSGIDMSEIYQMVVIGLGALGVYAVPNKESGTLQ